MWQESFLITLFVLKKCGEIQNFCEIFDFFKNKNGHHSILVSIPPLFNIKFLGFKLANNSEMGQLIKKVYIDKPPLNGPKYLKISFKSFSREIFGSSKIQYGRHRNPVGDFFFKTDINHL